jgi:cob(I)alamin adenosyltransferase
MKIYTKTGDDGTTGLFGAGRIPKDHLRIEAYGTVDELNAVLGICLAQPEMETLSALKTFLVTLQNTLFVVGGDLASPVETEYPVPRVTAAHILSIEAQIDAFDASLPPLKVFILPGGHPIAAHLHLCRTVTRRAERICVALHRQEPLSSPVIQFLNRLSDFFFTAARWTNVQTQTPEVAWQK